MVANEHIQQGTVLIIEKSLIDTIPEEQTEDLIARCHMNSCALNSHMIPGW